ncbi:MAG: hypothetical protein AB1689_22170 [Thermodesulfobacteriota bacterium]
MATATEYLVKRSSKMEPSHPGAIVAECLDHEDVSITRTAAELHV